MIRIDHYVSFCKIIELGSFSAAAEVLGISQSAISQQMKTLENLYGSSLLHRSGSRVLMTEDGEKLQEYALQILSLYERSMTIKKQKMDVLSGRIAVGASSGPAEFPVPIIMGLFKKKFPGVKLSLHVNDSSQVIEDVLKEKLEGRVDKKIGMIVAITDIVEIGEGKILIGDGGVYYETTFDAIVFRPQIQEIIEGKVIEIVEFGAFVGIGPMDGLLHVSQISDEYISYDEKNARLVGKESGRELKEGDVVRVRIVAISLNEREPGESKIGLTMRQPALGKLEWIEEALKKEKVEW